MNPLVTLGIFTYQRPKLLKRLLNFLNDLGSDHRVIILDGSDGKEFIQYNKELATKYKAEYLQHPSMQQRHVMFFNKIETPYVAWGADDDLILPSFYNVGAKFLKENQEYSVATGQLYTLHYLREKSWRGYYLGNFLGNHYDFYHGDFAERIVRKDQAYAMGCPPTFYGVRRYDDVKIFCNYVMNVKLHSSAERLENIINLLNGGMKVIDTLMGFRDYASETTRALERDDPETYISLEDTLVLKQVIRDQLMKKINNPDLLEYYASYAWPMPLRLNQTGGKSFGPSRIEKIQSKINLFFAHHFHDFDKDVTKALRNAVTNFK